MGESTTFHCDECGYESKEIRWGVSVVDPRVRFMPAKCSRCREYVEVDLTGADLCVDEFRCRTCGAEVTFIDKATAYGCPKCPSPTIKLRQGPAYW